LFELRAHFAEGRQPTDQLRRRGRFAQTAPPQVLKQGKGFDQQGRFFIGKTADAVQDNLGESLPGRKGNVVLKIGIAVTAPQLSWLRFGSPGDRR